MPTLQVAAVQAEPVLMDAKGCLAKAVDLVERASSEGAEMVVLPETFVPGYGQWAHHAPFEDEVHKRAYARLARNSVRVPHDLDAVADVARRTATTVVLPVTERDPDTPGTLYNTISVFDAQGEYVGKHRKLVPTHHERTLYGYGNGDTLEAFEVDAPTTGGAAGSLRFGGLLCWNNFMPLARYALYQQGIQLYLAPTADDLESWQTAMKFIARESRCYVVAPALLQHRESFPPDWELRGDPVWEDEPDWNERGGSVILGPDGDVLAGPVYEEEAILHAQVDIDRVVEERHTFDPAGHYAREEVLQLRVAGLDPSVEDLPGN